MSSTEPRLSEGRQLALILAGLLGLSVLGIGAAIVFPEPCEELEREASLSLSLGDASAVLPVNAQVESVLHGLGDELGIGGWRGALPLQDGWTVQHTEAGFLVASPEVFTVVRPTYGVVSAGRDRAGLDLVQAGGSYALVGPEGAIGVFDGQYELDRCGTVPAGMTVLDVDRGFAVGVLGEDFLAVGLGSGELWREPLQDIGAIVWAQVRGDEVLIATPDEVTVRALPDGAPAASSDGAAVPLDLDRDPMLVGPGLDGLSLEEDGTLSRARLGSGTVTAAATTPRAIVALTVGEVGPGITRTVHGSDDGSPVPQFVAVPEGVSPQAVVASDDGYVGVVVELDGVRALLLWGPDADPA